MNTYLDIAKRVELKQSAEIPQEFPEFLRILPPPDFDAIRARKAEARQAALAGLVNPGWTPQSWIERTNHLAALCRSLNPEVAVRHRERAAALEGGAT